MVVIPSGVGHAAASDLSDVPEVPGIYAWYVRFPEKKNEWVRGKATFLELMTKADEALRPPKLDVALSSTAFPTQWTGDARVEALREWPEAFRILSDDESGREAIWAALSEIGAVPFLSGPLYIGMTVAQGLRTRLSQHAHALQKADEVEENEAREFAERCASKGIGLEWLQVWYVEFELDQGVTGALVEAVEGLLNRWTRPAFGRR